MAILSLCVPREISRILSGIDLGLGEKVDASGMHITVCYLGKGISIERVASMLTPIFEVVSKTRPFTVSTSHVTTFPANPDDGVPIIAKVDSNELQDFRGRLVKALTEAIPDFPKDKYPVYAPHVTLAYSKDPLVDADNAVDKQIPTVEWGVGEVTLWGGDVGDERFFVTFPLAVPMTRAAMNQAFVRIASMKQARYDEWNDKYLTDDMRKHALVAIERAKASHDTTSVNFLQDMLDRDGKNNPLTPKQQGYFFKLVERYYPNKERQEAEDKKRAEYMAELARDKAWEEQSTELADIARDFKHDGWVNVSTKKYFEAGVTFNYSDPPYFAQVERADWPKNTDLLSQIPGHKIHTRVNVTVSKDNKVIFRHQLAEKYPETEAVVKAQKEAMGAIEKDKRTPVPTVEPVHTTAPESPKDRIKKLEEAAAAAHNKWMTEFAQSIAQQVARGRTLSPKQEAMLEKGYKMYKLAHDENGYCDPNCSCHKKTLAQRVVATFLQRQV